MRTVYELDGDLFETEALAKEAQSKVVPGWGRAVGYNRHKTPRSRVVIGSMAELRSWGGRRKWGNE